MQKRIYFLPVIMIGLISLFSPHLQAWVIRTCEAEMERIWDCERWSEGAKEFKLSNGESVRNVLSKKGQEEDYIESEKLKTVWENEWIKFRKKWSKELGRIKAGCKDPLLKTKETWDWIANFPEKIIYDMDERHAVAEGKEVRLVSMGELRLRLGRCGISGLKTIKYLEERRKKIGLKNKSSEAEAHKKKLNETFEFVKKSIIDRLLMGRLESELSSVEKSYLKKIKTISDPQIYPEDNPMCLEQPLQAAYSPWTHSFSVCSKLLTQSKAALTFIVAHELAHAIDPCRIQFTLGRIVPHSLMAKNFGRKETATNVWQDNQDFNDGLQKVIKDREKGVKLTNLGVGLEGPLGDEKFEKNMIMSGAFQVRSNGVKPSEDLQRKTLSCLVTQSKGEIKDWDPLSQVKAIDEWKAFMEHAGQKVDRSSLLALEKRSLEHPHCETLEPWRASQTTEAMSDYWGSLILSDYLKEQRIETDEDKFSLLPHLAKEKCGLISYIAPENKEAFDKKSFYEAGFMMKKALKFDNDPHPLMRVRALRIILANPTIASIFGCKNESDTRTCFGPEYFGNKGKTDSKESSDRSSSTGQ